MSQSPMEATEDPATPRNRAYRKANKRKDEMLRSGVSLSGRERNCCFLNTGAQRFANVSAAAGLDHLGDGRAYALVDWDHDGDLDLWMTNRNSPRVQFLRNNRTGENHFLSIKLEGNGTTTNRDAIGVRVEVVLANPNSEIPHPKLIKSLRSGEGFLSQSSKVVHFGLGENEEVDHVEVRWPGGNVEKFTGLRADHTYEIIQGSNDVKEWSRPVNASTLQASKNEAARRTDVARIPLRFPIPLPTLHYQTFEGRQVSIDRYHGSPTLINLWASWCQPCLRELAEFREHADELRNAGLNIVALSVDAVSEDAAANQDLAKSLWKSQEFPFKPGLADSALIDKLEAVLYYLFDHRRSWSVPTSFLLNSEGRLSAIYVGRVDINVLLSDINAMNSNELAWLQSSLPFQGRWADEQRHPDMWPFVASMFDKNYTDEAIDFFTRLEEMQAPTEDYPLLLQRVADALREGGDLLLAHDRYKELLKIDPDNSETHLLLSNVLLGQGHDEEAMQHCREVIRLDPENIDAHVGLGMMLHKVGESEEAIDYLRQAIALEPGTFQAHMTLGSIYFDQRKLDLAIRHFTKSARIDREAVEPYYQLARALQRDGQVEKSLLGYDRAIQMDSQNSAMHYSYGTALMELGRLEEAVEQFNSAYKLDQDSLPAINGLAWLLATRETRNQGHKNRALGLAKLAAEKTGYKHPQILDTLGAAYAANSEFSSAISTAEKAIKLASETGRDELVDDIRGRLKLYRSGKPYRE